jgi:hypothetical protein
MQDLRLLVDGVEISAAWRASRRSAIRRSRRQFMLTMLSLRLHASSRSKGAGRPGYRRYATLAEQVRAGLAMIDNLTRADSDRLLTCFAKLR